MFNSARHPPLERISEAESVTLAGWGSGVDSQTAGALETGQVHTSQAWIALIEADLMTSELKKNYLKNNKFG